MKIAFHTPLNRYGSGTPSGDRLMARQLVTLLRGLGHDVEIVAAERSFMRQPDPALLAAHCQAARAVSGALAERWRVPEARPDLFFTYHCHYRAPDLIGPDLAAGFGLPYVLAEASDAQKRFDGPWAEAAMLARAAILRADLHFCMTARDREGLSRLIEPERLVDLPPFLLGLDEVPERAPPVEAAEVEALEGDAYPLPPACGGEGLGMGGRKASLASSSAQSRAALPPTQPSPPQAGRGLMPLVSGGAPPQAMRCNSPVRLIAAAMMRPGTKAGSYLVLARTLARIVDLPWTLTLIGDGSERAEIEAAFAGFPPGRVAFLGRRERAETLAEFAHHDLFVWPGLNEAYGVVYLEAQAAGLPVAALDSGGVPDVVARDRSAILVPDRDEAALAAAIARLIGDADLRRRMGEAAGRFARQERNGDGARAILGGALATLMQGRGRATGEAAP